MKKTAKTAMTAALFAAAAGMTACAGSSIASGGENYLGSASDENTSEVSYDPADEEIQDVYGPAPDYEDTTEDITTTEALIEATTEEMQCVYGPPQSLGDLNSDGVCNSSDEVLIRKWLTNGYDPYQEYLADVNNDGSFDNADLIAIHRYIIGKDKDFSYNYDPGDDMAYGVYGPAPDYAEETTSVTTEPITTETAISETTTMVQCVYGPPEAFGSDTE